jgi:hypothetical protein
MDRPGHLAAGHGGIGGGHMGDQVREARLGAALAMPGAVGAARAKPCRGGDFRPDLGRFMLARARAEGPRCTRPCAASRPVRRCGTRTSSAPGAWAREGNPGSAGDRGQCTPLATPRSSRPFGAYHPSQSCPRNPRATRRAQPHFIVSAADGGGGGGRGWPSARSRRRLQLCRQPGPAGGRGLGGAVPCQRAALAIERHASFAPTARHAALRTRACAAGQPATAQPRDRRRPASAPTHTRSHPPSRPDPRCTDPRCTHRCTAAEHQHRRSPGIAGRSRSRQAKADHHPGPQVRTWSVAGVNAQTAEAPRTRPATRPGLALCAPVPRRRPGALGCEHDKPPRPPLGRRNRRR